MSYVSQRAEMRSYNNYASVALINTILFIIFAFVYDSAVIQRILLMLFTDTGPTIFTSVVFGLVYFMLSVIMAGMLTGTNRFSPSEASPGVTLVNSAVLPPLLIVALYNGWWYGWLVIVFSVIQFIYFAKRGVDLYDPKTAQWS